MSRPRRQVSKRRRAHVTGIASSAIVFLIAAGWASARLATHSTTTHVPVGESGSTAPPGCGEDGKVISGGFSNPDFDRETSKLFLWGFNPAEIAPGGSWRVTAANLGEGPTGSGTLKVFAYCAKRRSRLIRRLESKRIGPLETGGAVARCPQGTRAVSGGFSDSHADLSGARLFGFRSRRAGPRGWRASAYNMSTTHSGRLIVVAYCDPREPEVHARSRTVQVQLEDTASVVGRCAEGQVARSGGFGTVVDAETGAGAFPIELRRRSPRSWVASAFDEQEAAMFSIYVYCSA